MWWNKKCIAILFHRNLVIGHDIWASNMEIKYKYNVQHPLNFSCIGVRHLLIWVQTNRPLLTTNLESHYLTNNSMLLIGLLKLKTWKQILYQRNKLNLLSLWYMYISICDIDTKYGNASIARRHFGRRLEGSIGLSK